MAAKISGDCEIDLKTGSVPGVKMKLQMNVLHEPHSEDQGKTESREGSRNHFSTS